mgnify:CR=1 FL=1
MQRREFLKHAAPAMVLGMLAVRPLLAAASGTPAPSPEAGAGVLLVRWQLREMTLPDGTALVPDAPPRYTIQLLPDGRVLVQADCNGGAGTYSRSDGALAFHDLVTTLIGCGPASIGAEFTEVLGRVNTFWITTEASDHLVLHTVDGGTLHFVPTLHGVTWQWVRFRSGRGDEVVPDDPARYTLTIGDDGTARVVAACNHGEGPARIENESIDLTLTMTQMACEPGSLGEEYVGYLTEAVSWVIRDGQLHLSLPMDAGIASFAPVVPPASPTATPEATPAAR